MTKNKQSENKFQKQQLFRSGVLLYLNTSEHVPIDFCLSQSLSPLLPQLFKGGLNWEDSLEDSMFFLYVYWKNFFVSFLEKKQV